MHTTEHTLLGALVDALPLGIILYRVVGNNLILETNNPAASNILDIDVTSLRGKSMVEAFPAQEEAQYINDTYYSNTYLNKAAVDWGVVDYITPGGSRKHLSVYGIPVSHTHVAVCFSSVAADEYQESSIIDDVRTKVLLTLVDKVVTDSMGRISTHLESLDQPAA